MTPDRAALMRDILCRLSATASPLPPPDVVGALSDDAATDDATLRAALAGDTPSLHDTIAGAISGARQAARA